MNKQTETTPLLDFMLGLCAGVFLSILFGLEWWV